MNRKLRDEDRMAIDLLLDRTPRIDANGATMPPPALSAHSGAHQSVAVVGSLLHLLDQLPPEEPPSDLVQRTLKYIAEQTVDGQDEFAPEESLSDSGMFTL